MTNVTLSSSSPAGVRADALVFGLRSAGDGLAIAPGGEALDAAYGGGGLVEQCTAVGAKAEKGSIARLPGGPGVKAPLLIAVGLGDGDASLETLRRAVGAAVRSAGKAATVALALPADTDEQVGALIEGALMGLYAFDHYQSEKKTRASRLVVLTSRARAAGAKRAAESAQTVADAVGFCRDLVNLAPNDLYPESFVDIVRGHIKESPARITVTTLDERQLAAKGYGGILGVGQGARRQPRLLRMSYRPARAKAHIALVGKGITFDSGGLSIKSSVGMQTMKCDMAGAAAVSAAIVAIAELGLPVRVTAYACLAENMPGGGSTRPGDVLHMHGGQTVEVLNTDAEGRLVLADGIATANRDHPDLLVDVATLTGACVIALGRQTSGVFSNDEALHTEVPAAAAAVGESMWALPITEEMREKVRATKIADLSQHNPEPFGGASFAAAFLREFVADGTPWAHLDIAGPAFNSGSPQGYTPVGGTGTAVRTLVELARRRA